MITPYRTTLLLLLVFAFLPTSLYATDLAVKKKANQATVAVSDTVIYTYDARGRLTEATYGSDMSITYTYDANGNLLSKVKESPHKVAVEEGTDLPTRFVLKGNYPNPFNPVTTIPFDLPETADVRIEVIDVLGRRVLSLPAQTVQAGFGRALELDVSALASGVYFYRVLAQTKARVLVETGRMVMIK